MTRQMSSCDALQLVPSSTVAIPSVERVEHALFLSGSTQAYLRAPGNHSCSTQLLTAEER
jgi:hypothetical protein